MVAYSFTSRFVPAIAAGTKTRTIRAYGKRRHARSGEALQLYTGLRTRQAKLIRVATCIRAVPVRLAFEARVLVGARIWGEPVAADELDDFARADGFAGAADMGAWWCRDRSDGSLDFDGLLIEWAP